MTRSTSPRRGRQWVPILIRLSLGEAGGNAKVHRARRAAPVIGWHAPVHDRGGEGIEFVEVGDHMGSALAMKASELCGPNAVDRDCNPAGGAHERAMSRPSRYRSLVNVVAHGSFVDDVRRDDEAISAAAWADVSPASSRPRAGAWSACSQTTAASFAAPPSDRPPSASAPATAASTPAAPGPTATSMRCTRRSSTRLVEDKVHRRHGRCLRAAARERRGDVRTLRAMRG
jgi:hypothetical protein